MELKILILEDDASFGLMLNNWFRKKGFKSVLCQNVQAAKKTAMSETFSIILSDLRLPDGDGIMFLAWLRENKIETPLIIMTSYGEIQSAITSMKLGAEDYIQKPINPDVLMEKIHNALDKVNKSTSSSAKSDAQANDRSGAQQEIITGKSPAAKQMEQYINLIAPTHLSVLLLGESGTGKEFAAKAIHLKSKRKDKPFIAVDCGCLSKDLAPSELFGHLKGSFTSAIENKKGVFEQANGGTLFLDEIGNLSYDIQIQLLRSIQERRIRPVGSSVDKEVDVRIIAATNEDLEQAIATGKFRQDLYHRINEFSINIPPLRDRKQDIGIFAAHFLKLANAEIDKNIRDISPESIKLLENYSWPGNLRELRNVIRRAALFCNGDTIQTDDIPKLTVQEEIKQINLSPEDERERIIQAINAANGNKTLAAKLLGIDRKTLYNKLKDNAK